MISLRYYLDTRHGAEESSLKLCISSHGRCAYLTLGIRLRGDQWDAAQQRILNHPNEKQSNITLLLIRSEAAEYLAGMKGRGELAGLTSTQIKDLVKDGISLSPSLTDMLRFIAKCDGKEYATVERDAFEAYIENWTPNRRG